jgi:hypothetical protein
MLFGHHNNMFDLRSDELLLVRPFVSQNSMAIEIPVGALCLDVRGAYFFYPG